MDNQDIFDEFSGFSFEEDADFLDDNLPRFLFDDLSPTTGSIQPGDDALNSLKNSAIPTSSIDGARPGSDAMESIKKAVREFKSARSSTVQCNVISGWRGQQSDWLCSFDKDPDVKIARYGHDKKSKVIVEIDGEKFRFYIAKRRLDCRKDHGFIARIQEKKGKFQFVDYESQESQVDVSKKRRGEASDTSRDGRSRIEADPQTGFNVVHWTRTKLNDKDWQLRIVIPGVGECSVHSSQFSPIESDVWFHYVSEKGKPDHRAAFSLQSEGSDIYLVFRGRHQEKHLLRQLQPNVFTFSREHPMGMITYTIDFAKKKERRDYASTGEHKIVRFK